MLFVIHWNQQVEGRRRRRRDRHKWRYSAAIKKVALTMLDIACSYMHITQSCI